MIKNKYIISYSIQLILTLAVLGAVIWYAQIMPINTPLISAFNFDLAQFGIIIGLVIICLVYIFILVGFLVAAIRQKQKGREEEIHIVLLRCTNLCQRVPLTFYTGGQGDRSCT